MKVIKGVLVKSGVIVIAFATLGFVHISSVEPRWGGDFPIIALKINPDVAGFNLGDESAILSAARSSAAIWSFPQALLRTKLSISATTSQKSPVTPSQISCDDNARMEMAVADNIIFSPTVRDPDCTGPACAFIWSCGRDFLHSNTQINSIDFTFTNGAAANNYDLSTVLTRLMGHILGLGHCAPDDPECVNEHGTKPPADAVMSRTQESNLVSTTLGSDDLNGILKLYGSLKSEELKLLNEFNSFYSKIGQLCSAGCLPPSQETDPNYTLTAGEISALSEHAGVMAEEGFERPQNRLKVMQLHQDLYLSAMLSAQIPVERYMLEAVNEAVSKFRLVSDTTLPGQLQMLTVNISNSERTLTEFSTEMDATFHRFAVTELRALIIIRKALIDELRGRGLL